MKSFLSLLFVLIFGLSISGQTSDFEYGKPAELKGLTKVYIDTGADVKNHNKISEAIEKSKISMIQIVDELKDADIILMFRADKEDVLLKGTTNREDTGKGFVAIKGKNPNKMRLLIDFTSRKDSRLEDDPSNKYVKEFLKQYRVANDLKK